MKKKFYYAGMLAAGLLTFASCNNDDDPIIDQNQVQTEVEEGQVIRIAVANAGDGLTTRAGRPLFSSVADQEIDKVTVYIFDGSQKIVADTTYNNWATDAVSEVYTSNGHGRQATWKLAGDKRLAVNGNYTAYAVGYTSVESLYDNAISTFEGLKESGTFGLFSSTPSLTNGNLGEEIFAGELAIHVDEEGNIDVSQDPEANVLTLHRQVAGTMGYFTSIPTVKAGQYVKYVEGEDENPGTYKVFGVGVADATNGAAYTAADAAKMSLRLVSSTMSNFIVFDEFNSEFTDSENSEAWFVVNGVYDTKTGVQPSVTTANFSGVNNNEAGTVLYTIPLGDWFPNGDVNNDGLLDEADAVNPENWNTPAYVQGASFVDGSVFAGEFLIPFAKVAGKNTLQLQLVAADGNTVMRTWDINLPQDDAQIWPEKGHAQVWNGQVTGIAFTAGVEESASSYSMVRNHLYTIGAKETNEVGPGDEPEELSKGQRITLRVNDNWELIHRMEVE